MSEDVQLLGAAVPSARPPEPEPEHGQPAPEPPAASLSAPEGWEWRRWFPAPPAEPAGAAGVLDWIDATEEQLLLRIEQLDSEHAALRGQWKVMAGNLGRFRPEEVSGIVEALAVARENLAAGHALLDLLQAQRAATEPLRDAVAAGGERRVLDDLLEDRVALARALGRAPLNALCTLALELEFAEIRAAEDPAAVGMALGELRERVAAVARQLRDLPHPMTPADLAVPTLLAAVRRCVEGYSGILHIEIETGGGDLPMGNDARDTVGVLQEILHQLFISGAEQASVMVLADAASGLIRVRVVAPGETLSPDGDPVWLSRARTRAQLSGGRLLCFPMAQGSAVELSIG